MQNLLTKTFKNKKVIITGHTGFKGSWLTAWLKLLGANVVGISLNNITYPSHFEEANIGKGIEDIRLDIRDKIKLASAINDHKPDFIFHLAAQAIVKESYYEPLETWETNVIGSMNVLDAIKQMKKKCSVVMITSDKCYENVEWIWGYKETDSLGGADPYSASKAATEIGISSYVRSFFKPVKNIRIASARAGNVIGGGDWAENRIVPDIIKAWSNNKIVNLRNPHSTRPWQHVMEPLSGYLNLAAQLSVDKNLHGESFNFGPSDNKNYSVKHLVESMSKYWNKSEWKIIKTSNEHHESGLLKLNCDKALGYIGWSSVMNFDETIKFTIDWYVDYYKKNRGFDKITESQIKKYMKLAKEKKIIWAM